jgi:hypothetical protein
MARLPVVGSDRDQWGELLNEFLSVAHESDGSLKDDSIPAGKLSSTTQASLVKADSSVQSVNAKFPSSGEVTLTASDVGAAELNSPAFTGNPTVPNQTAGTNNTRAANTAYVDTALTTKADAKATTIAKTALFTITTADAAKTLEVDVAVDTPVLIPTDSTDSVPVGSIFDVARIGAGVPFIRPELQNLISNPSVETNTAGYVARGTSASISRINNGGVKKGTWGLRVTSGAAGNLGFFYTSQSLSAMGLKPGDKVSWRYDVLTAISGGASLSIRFLNASATISETFGNYVPANTSGTTKAENITIPAGCDGMSIVLNANASGAGATIDCDGMMLVKGPTAPAAYVDPDSDANMAWSGTAHGSPSAGPTVRGALTGIGQYGRVRLRKRGVNDWLIESQPQDDVLTQNATLYTDRDNGQPGMLAPADARAASTLALTANTAYLARFVPSRKFSITMIAFAVTTASGTDDPVDVGIYDSSLAKIVSSGATTGKLNSTGVKTVTITTTTLLPGVVYYAVIAANSTATLASSSAPSVGAASLFGSAAPQVEMASKTASYVLPTSLSGSTAAAAVPTIAVRES